MDGCNEGIYLRGSEVALRDFCSCCCCCLSVWIMEYVLFEPSHLRHNVMLSSLFFGGGGGFFLEKIWPGNLGRDSSSNGTNFVYL